MSRDATAILLETNAAAAHDDSVAAEADFQVHFAVIAEGLDGFAGAGVDGLQLIASGEDDAAVGELQDIGVVAPSLPPGRNRVDGFNENRLGRRDGKICFNSWHSPDPEQAASRGNLV